MMIMIIIMLYTIIKMLKRVVSICGMSLLIIRSWWCIIKTRYENGKRRTLHSGNLSWTLPCCSQKIAVVVWHMASCTDWNMFSTFHSYFSPNLQWQVLTKKALTTRRATLVEMLTTQMSKTVVAARPQGGCIPRATAAAPNSTTAIDPTLWRSYLRATGGRNGGLNNARTQNWCKNRVQTQDKEYRL